MGLPAGSVVRNLPANAGDMGSIPGSGRYLGEGNSNPLQYSWPGESHGRRSLVGYSSQGCKKSDRTEQLHSLNHSNLVY